MIGNFIFLVTSLLVSGITWYLYAILRASGLRERRMAGFGALCIIVPFWIILNAVSYIVTPEFFSALYILKAFPLNIIPYLSCWFFLNFSESKAADSRFIRYFSVVMPLLAIGLLTTNPWHNLYYLSFGNPPVTGPAFLAHLSISAIYILIVYVILFRYVVKHYRSDMLLIAGGVGAFIPIVIYAMYLFFPQVLYYDFTPMGYFLTILFVVYASYYSRLKKANPGILGNTLAIIANSREVVEGAVENAARFISKEACIALDAYRVRVWNYDNESHTLKIIACYNNSAGEYTAQEDFNMQGIANFVEYLMSERVIAISNTAEAMASMESPYDPEVCAVLLAPVRFGHELAGVVCVEQNYSKDFLTKREWNPEEQSFVSSLADLMVLTITNAERRSLIQRLEAEQAALRESLREERAAAEKLIKAEEAHRNLQVILDMLPVGIRILSIDDMTLLYSNKACLDLFGCSSFEEQVKYQSGYNFMPEFQPDGRKTTDVVDEIFERGWPVADIQCLRFNGEPFLCRVTSCIIDYGGSLASLAAMEDITEEHNRRQMLETIAIREQEANQLKSRFLATMSHEIRTPMNAVIGMTEIALRENDLDAKNKHILTAKQAASTLLAIVNDILDFSKIEAGKMDIIPRHYSIASMLSDTVSIIRTRIADLPIHFVIKADSKIPHTLIGDETKIRQAVLNVLSNAVKFTDEGHVILGIYADFVNEDIVNLTFEVTDTGIGIKQEDMDRLFSGFVQFDLEKNRSTEGTGLGLAITHSIVKAMGGDIRVQSKYGQGSTFIITIPQKFHSRDALAKVKQTEGKNVLVYEQREIYADSIIYTLDNLGVNYSRVTSDAGLIDEIKSRAYDYLFIPYKLLRKNEEKITKFIGDIKIVVLTGYDSAVSENHARVLTMPTYCIHVADILNDEHDESAHSPDYESFVRFTAPDARALIVDDIKTNLAVAQGLLAPYNMQVDLCDGGKAAIEAVSSTRYDIVFMDHKMPGIDGVEATRRIREMGKDPAGDGVLSGSYFINLPIIALTANAVSGVTEMFLENGFSGFLSKPIDLSKLNSILEEWIPREKQQFLS